MAQLHRMARVLGVLRVKRSSALKNALARHLSPDWQRCPPHACHGSSWAWRRPRQWRSWACWLSPVMAAGCAASTTPPPFPLSGRKAAAVVGAAGPAATQGRQRAVPGARRGRRPPILLLPLPVPALGTSRHPPGRRAAILSAKSALIKVREAAGAGPVPTASGCCCFSPIQRQLAAGRRARQAGRNPTGPMFCPLAGTLVLYDERYQPGPDGKGLELPQFSAEGGYGQFIYPFRNGVRASRPLCPSVPLNPTCARFCVACSDSVAICMPAQPAPMNACMLSTFLPMPCLLTRPPPPATAPAPLRHCPPQLPPRAARGVWVPTGHYPQPASKQQRGRRLPADPNIFKLHGSRDLVLLLVSESEPSGPAGGGLRRRACSSLAQARCWHQICLAPRTVL
jgi:hypothetical protein